jgi:hypothetical protein
MKKGFQVKVKQERWSHRPVLRHTTHEEQNEWYEKLYAECRAGNDVSYNCAGESKLAPRCRAIAVKDDDTFTVVRARCCPVLGWHKQPKSALIRNNRTGEEGYIRRIHLELVQ